MISFQVYWSSIFILPKKVINPVQQKLNAFLQKDKDAKINRAEVAWEVLARPKQEGGLGLKKLSDWNKTKILRHIWDIFAIAGSIWVVSTDLYFQGKKNL